MPDSPPRVVRAGRPPPPPRTVNEQRFLPTLSGGPFDGSQLPAQAGSPPQCYVFSAGDLEQRRAVDERPSVAPVYGDAYVLGRLGIADAPVYEYLRPAWLRAPGPREATSS